MSNEFEMVIGLEVHVELKTKTKIFCGCPTDFGAEPNTQCCPVCMGMPGTLPVLNKQVVDFAIQAGLATNCEIAKFSKQDRKNYFYPDLPKAYQISQYDLPLCEHGYLDIETKSGSKRIGITRIHIEEDAGKLVHDKEHGTMFDCNRCGVPLIEIVSEPDIRSADEARAYVQKLRSILMYTGVSDCKMNEGSLRCDVNLSIRRAGDKEFGTRTEMKNLNSINFIVKAIEYEYKRQVDTLKAGEQIIQETRRFDADSGKTYSMRSKENANDYRYFPDPDLPPIKKNKAEIDSLLSKIPTLPDQRKKEYTQKYGLTPYDAEIITSQKEFADYFEAAAKSTDFPKLAANLLIGEVFRMMQPDDVVIPISAKHLAEIAQMSGSNIINSSTAKKLCKMLWDNDRDPAEIVEEQGLAQINDSQQISAWADEVFAQNPKSIADYRKGKTAAMGALIGQVMAKSRGRANPALVNDIVAQKLSQQ